MFTFLRFSFLKRNKRKKQKKPLGPAILGHGPSSVSAATQVAQPAVIQVSTAPPIAWQTTNSVREVQEARWRKRRRLRDDAGGVTVSKERSGAPVSKSQGGPSGLPLLGPGFSAVLQSLPAPPRTPPPGCPPALSALSWVAQHGAEWPAGRLYNTGPTWLGFGWTWDRIHLAGPQQTWNLVSRLSEGLGWDSGEGGAAGLLTPRE